MTVESLRDHVRDLVSMAAKDRVLLTKGGKPFAFVTDASCYDEEDIGYMTDESFWQMIADRRKASRGRGIPIEQIKARIERDIQRERVNRAARKPRANSKRGKRSNATA